MKNNVIDDLYIFLNSNEIKEDTIYYAKVEHIWEYCKRKRNIKNALGRNINKCKKRGNYIKSFFDNFPVQSTISGKENYEFLTKSLKENGWVDDYPLLLKEMYKNGTSYWKVKNGHHRLNICREIGLEVIPIIIKKGLNMKNDNLKIKIRERSACVMDRYPQLFEELCSLNVYENILAFGCGKGEECITLNEYFEKSFILGVDIANHAIKSAKNKCKDIDNITIMNVDEYINDSTDFDIIFALNVFKRLKSTYEFQLYDEQLLSLQSKLKPGGLLILDGIQYDFVETETFKKHFNVYPLASDKFIKRRDKFSFNNYAFIKKDNEN